MNPSKLPIGPPFEEREVLPLSLLNDYLYCRRRAALKLVEGWREGNEHTERGELVHEHADFVGYESQFSDSGGPIVVLRALPVWSDRLGLNGKCDIVEVHGLPPGAVVKSRISNLKSLTTAKLRPVEFKLGKRRQWENDDVQLCAQALCLEEMFGLPVERGAVFHAKSKRRREVEFTPELRALTERAVAGVYALLRESEISGRRSQIAPLPPAEYRRACQECSLFDLCLPRVTTHAARVARAAQQLFET